MVPNISVVIPWRPMASRQYAFDIVRKWYEDNLPEATIITADDGREPFCLAGTRNVGVKQAEEAGADVVILNDADTIPQLAPLLFAIEWALRGDRVVLPYTQYRSLQERGSVQFLRGKPIEQCDCFVVDGACSGVYVFKPQTWWSHYGQDERFRGWGFEDAAWFVAHKTLLGREPKRVEGKVYAFSHTSALKEGPNYEANAQLCAQYLSAQFSAEYMRELASQGLFIDDSVV